MASNIIDEIAYQEGSIGSSDGAVGLDESRLQLGHLLRSGDTNAVVLGHGGGHAGHLEWNDVREVTVLLSLMRKLVRPHGVVVLLLTAHVERGGQSVSRVAHGLVR
jgi:hypothetical protein